MKEPYAKVDTHGFTQEVVEVLGCYVYRLIDPRNGETFYVGRGRGQRVFDHVSGAISDADQSAADPKLERIHEIQAFGYECSAHHTPARDVGGGG